MKADPRVLFVLACAVCLAGCDTGPSYEAQRQAIDDAYGAQQQAILKKCDWSPLLAKKKALEDATEAQQEAIFKKCGIVHLPAASDYAAYARMQPILKKCGVIPQLVAIEKASDAKEGAIIDALPSDAECNREFMHNVEDQNRADQALTDQETRQLNAINAAAAALSDDDAAPQSYIPLETPTVLAAPTMAPIPMPVPEPMASPYLPPPPPTRHYPSLGCIGLVCPYGTAQ